MKQGGHKITERNRRCIDKRNNLMEEKIRNQRLTIRLDTDRSGDKSTDGGITGADERLLTDTKMRRIRANNASGEGQIIVRTVIRGCGVYCKSIGCMCDR